MENKRIMETSYCEEDSQDCSPRSASLARLFSWTLLGNVGFAACQWMLLVILAKYGELENVGIYSLALAVTTPVYLLANLELRGILATQTSGDRMIRCSSVRRLNQLDTGAYVGMRIVCSCTALVISFLIGLYSGCNTEMLAVIVLVACAKMVESGSDIVYGWWQRHEQMRWIAISLLWRGIGSVIVFGGIYRFWGQLSVALVGYIFVWLFVLLLYDIPKARELPGFGVQWNMGEWGRLFRYCWPIGTVMMMVSLRSNVPRYFIAHSFGIEVLGYISTLMSVVAVGATVMTAIGQSISPRIARWYSSGNRKQLVRFLLQMTGVICGGAAVSIVMVIMAGKEILTLVYRASYAEYQELFIWITIAASIGYLSSLCGYTLTAARKFHSQVIVHVVVLGVTIFSNWLYLNMGWGIMSVAYALTTASIIQLVGSMWILRSTIRQLG